MNSGYRKVKNFQNLVSNTLWQSPLGFVDILRHPITYSQGSQSQISKMVLTFFLASASAGEGE